VAVGLLRQAYSALKAKNHLMKIFALDISEAVSPKVLLILKKREN